MPTHLRHNEKETFYFITFTCYKWINLFEESDIYDYMPSWFQRLREKGCLLNAFVIMPNHLHMIVYITPEVKNLNTLIGESKRFLAYEIVKRLKRKQKVQLLQILQAGVQTKEKTKGKKHQVFRLSFDAKPMDEKTVLNTLDYIHHNPVMGKWKLIEDFTNYAHSSAAFYENGNDSNYPLLDFRNIYSESSTSDSEEK